MKTIKDLREFIVNIPSDCDDEDSVEYEKLSPDAIIEGGPDLNRLANTLTGNLVKKLPKKGLLPSGKLTSKYAFRVTPQLAKMMFLIGTRGKFDFGNHVFEKTIKHAGYLAVKLPILFPCLLSELIVHQHPDIVRANQPQGKKPLPLNFDYRLFVRTHVPDIMLFVEKGTSSVSGTKAPGPRKEDIVVELQEISKTLQDTIQACKVRKHNVDQLIKALTNVPAAEAEEVEEDEDVEGGEEEAQYETVEEEEKEPGEEEDVNGSANYATHSASLRFLSLDVFAEACWLCDFYSHGLY
ncbi:uncharacterized protein LOC130735956 [Lotus japonicus]|uniref:uncharacterized protein LOC130735956 n=1 Tax=Lotus japonicus TaxID=34305 RepID=UPI00258A5605|nr:uncharacterized protein LOC130735956 [Lotus japonicus]